ncbi:hypothetical protein VPHD81_0029 [Vibrio phage D81]
MSYILSPDTERVLEAISIINGGASIVPEDLDAAVSHMISKIGSHAIRDTCGMAPDIKRSYLVGYAAAVANMKNPQ